MSFILEALKKLEQKRQQGTVPDLMTIHADERQRSVKRPIWPYIALGALVLNAGLLAAVFRPWEDKDQRPAAAVTVERQNKTITQMPGQQEAKGNAQASVSSQFKESAAAPDKRRPVEKSSKPSGAIIAVTKKETLSQKPEIPGSSSKDKSKEPDQATESPVDNQSLPKDTSASLRMNTSPREMEDLRKKIKEETFHPGTPNMKDKAVSNDKAGPDKQVIQFDQLPAETKKELPKISISAHIYSNNPGSRIVNVNGSTIREGDEVVQGLTVRDITIDGVVFDYKGTLFEVRAF